MAVSRTTSERIREVDMPYKKLSDIAWSECSKAQAAYGDKAREAIGAIAYVCSRIAAVLDAVELERDKERDKGRNL